MAETNEENELTNTLRLMTVRKKLLLRWQKLLASDIGHHHTEKLLTVAKIKLK